MKARLLLMGGMALLLFAWLGPLPAAAHGSFAAHMGLHIIVIAVAAPLIAAGWALRESDGARFPAMLAASPAIASLVEFVVVWTWHTPALHRLAVRYETMLAFEQLAYLGAGLWIWLAAFAGVASQRRDYLPAGVAGLLLTSMHMTLLGVLLMLAERPLYSHEGAAQHAAALLQDQQLGGMIMLLGGGVSYLLGGLYLLFRLLKLKPLGVEGADHGKLIL